MTDEEILKKIETGLEQIRPNIQMDGGDVEFVRYDNGIVYIRLHGACVGCPAATFTVKDGIEEVLKEHLYDLREVVALEE